MGCDIHAVIEYEKHNSYHDFAEVNIPRDYNLFSAIAFGDGGITDKLPYPPRGIPADYSLKVSELFFTSVEELKKFLKEIGDDEFEPEEIAKGWGDWAVTEYISNGNLPGMEIHTPGWLLLDEIKTALDRAKLDINKLSPEFRAVLSVMQILSETYGIEKVRFVFWFDG
jgi:hypothetical protein